MPVISGHTNLFGNCKELYQFLNTYQAKANNHYPTTHLPIFSFSIEIDTVDPLAVLHAIARPNQPHFYFEQRQQGKAIAAIGSVLSFETVGQQRFAQAQLFIEHCLERLICSKPLQHVAAMPRFFCSFKFFDEPLPSSTQPYTAHIFLPQWQILRQQNRCVVTANIILSAERPLEKVTNDLWQQLQMIRRARFGLFHLPDVARYHLQQQTITPIGDFRSRVVKALKRIDQQQLHKVVIAQATDIVAALPFDWIGSLHNLRQRYPDCYVFSVNQGEACFIGASPERLLHLYDRTLLTDALAGSAPRGKTYAEDLELANQLLNSPKERREHKFVVDFIAQQLSQLGLSPQFQPIPELLQLSNIQHLHTPIQSSISTALPPLHILARLHPTPAVAGISRDAACDYIWQQEPFERSLYAAPLGWIDTEGNAEFVVGIRSALLNGPQARLYAGAGIVRGSDPNRELAEIQLKLRALLQTLV